MLKFCTLCAFKSDGVSLHFMKNIYFIACITFGSIKKIIHMSRTVVKIIAKGPTSTS